MERTLKASMDHIIASIEWKDFYSALKCLFMITDKDTNLCLQKKIYIWKMHNIKITTSQCLLPFRVHGKWRIQSKFDITPSKKSNTWELLLWPNLQQNNTGLQNWGSFFCLVPRCPVSLWSYIWCWCTLLLYVMLLIHLELL